MTRALVIHRKSTEPQDFARQVADTNRLIHANSYHVVKTVQLCVSGTQTQYNQEFQHAVHGNQSEYQVIVASDLDRLLRMKRYDDLRLFDSLVASGKQIHTVREGLIDPRTDEGFDKILSAGGSSGREWRTLIRRTHDGRIEHLRSGKLDHGSAPFGFIYVPKWQKNGCRFDVDPERASIVRQVYEWCRSGIPTYRIAKNLNESGHKSARGGRFSRQVVLQILRNPAYKGEHRRFGILVPCPGIIDRDLWEEVQRLIAASRAKHVGRPSRKYLLRGLLWCGRCGRRCITYPNHARPNYRCGNFTAKPPVTRKCDAPSVTQSVIESAAWSEIWSVLTNPDLLRQLARAYYESQEQPNEVGAIENQIARLRTRLSTVQDMVKDGILDYAQGRSEIRNLQDQIKDRENEMHAAGKVLSLPSNVAIESAVREILAGPEPSTYEDRRAILEGILDLRMIYDSGDLTIEGKIPVPAESTRYGEKNCNRRVGRTVNSFLSIPFILKRKVA